MYISNGKVISSDNLNIKDIDSYNNYDVFPKEIITKCLQIKDSDYLTKKIKNQIDNYYNETY